MKSGGSCEIFARSRGIVIETTQFIIIDTKSAKEQYARPVGGPTNLVASLEIVKRTGKLSACFKPLDRSACILSTNTIIVESNWMFDQLVAVLPIICSYRCCLMLLRLLLAQQTAATVAHCRPLAFHGPKHNKRCDTNSIETSSSACLGVFCWTLCFRCCCPGHCCHSTLFTLAHLFGQKFHFLGANSMVSLDHDRLEYVV